MKDWLTLIKTFETSNGACSVMTNLHQLQSKKANCNPLRADSDSNHYAQSSGQHSTTSWDSLLVRALHSLSEGCKFESQQEWRENFLLQSQLCVLTLIRCPFHPHITALACKRPRSFCQKCSWQVTSKHVYTLDPLKSEWADYAAVQTECGYPSENELTAHATRQGTLGHSHLSSLSYCGLILA